MFESLRQDLTYTIRTLRRNPGFAAVALLTLALGIGANTAIFSLVSPYLFRPLNFRQPEQLVHLFHVDQRIGFDMARFSLPQYADYRDQFQAFEDIAVYDYTSRNLGGRGEPEGVVVGRLSANMLRVLGVEPQLGRGLLPGEDRPGAEPVAILSHGLWQRRYAGDAGIVGQTVNLDEVPHTVVGIMPPDFNFPFGGVKMWSALQLEPTREARGQAGYLIVGRLRADRTLAQARAELETIHARLSSEHPDLDGQYGARAVPIRAGLLFYYEEIRTLLLLLMAGVGFVLLIVSANLGNILLARALGREREVAIRSALGSSRGRLLRQLLTESGTLAVLGAILGALIAFWVVRIIGPVMPEDLYRVGVARVDGSALVFTLLVAVLATLFFGLAPALQASGFNIAASLKEGGRGSSDGLRGTRLRSTLVVGQIAMTTLLLAGAVLMAQAFLEMQRADPGFDADRLLTVGVRLSSAKYPDHSQRAAFQADVLQAIGSLPQVESVGLVQRLPLDFSTNVVGFEVPGREPGSPDEEPFANLNLVSAGYFEAMGISVLRGRPFSDADNPDAPPVIAINQTMADRFWPGQDPVGRQVHLDEDEPEGGLATIAAVVTDVRHRWLTGDVWPQIYLPQSQHASRGFTLVVRSAGDPLQLSSSVRQAVWSVDPGLPARSVRSMNQVVAQSLGPFQLASGIFSFFGTLALLLACMGTYGIVAYAVGRRLGEFGVRLALGARAAQIVGLVVRQGVVLATIGMAIGLSLAVALGQLLSGSTAIVPRPGFLTYAAVALPLAVSVLLASYLPARRAARIDPASALRSS
jgi:putative ABC transport system permease protein